MLVPNTHIRIRALYFNVPALEHELLCGLIRHNEYVQIIAERRAAMTDAGLEQESIQEYFRQQALEEELAEEWAQELAQMDPENVVYFNIPSSK